MNSQRILAVGGLLLFLSSLAYGALYDAYLWRQNHQSMFYNLDMALNMAAKGDLMMSSAFAREFAAISRINELQARLPLHLALAGSMAILPLWMLSRLDMSERMKRMLALFIVSGGLLLAAGDFVQFSGPAVIGYYMTLGGYVWIGLGLAGFLIYTALFVLLHDEVKTRRERGGA